MKRFVESGAAALAALLFTFPAAHSVRADEPVVIQGNEDEPDIGGDGANTPAPAPAPAPPKRKGRKPAPRPAAKPVPKPEPAADPDDDGSEAVGPDGEGHCRTCGKPVHQDPGTPGIVDAIVDAFHGGHHDPLSLTGSRMSCAQRKFLTAMKNLNARKYGNRAFSRGDCGGGVGEGILAAGFSFERGNQRGGEPRLAKNYLRYCPRYNFIPTGATREADAPEGAICVFGGPQTPGVDPRLITPACRRHPVSAGTFNGHVTVKGSPSMDGGDQWYYTDGRTPKPAVQCRYFLGAFLPPGSDKGPAPTDGKGHFKCD